VGGLFAVDRTLGIVSTTSSQLDIQSVYRLTVQASDAGDPSLSSTAVLTVTVATSASTAPVFDHDRYSVEVIDQLAYCVSFVLSFIFHRDMPIISLHLSVTTETLFGSVYGYSHRLLSLYLVGAACTQ